MGAERDFPEDNWVRDTGKKTRADVLRYCLEREMPEPIARICGLSPSLRAMSQQGWSNFSYVLGSHGKDEWLLRLQIKPEDLNQENWSLYHKESWCMSAAAPYLPVPALPHDCMGYFELCHPGLDQPLEVAFIIQEFVQGTAARKHFSSKGTPSFLRELGEIASKIHAIPTNGFGAQFSPATNQFKLPDLRTFFENELEQLSPALAYIFYEAGISADSIKERIMALLDHEYETSLAHRDFLYNWGNVLVDDTGAIVSVIDWELAFSGPAFFMEMGAAQYAMMRDGLSQEERNRRRHWFLEGYGMPRKVYRKDYAAIVEDFTVWYSLKAVQKFLNFSENGEIKREPWRRLYAERSVRFIQSVIAQRPKGIFDLNGNKRKKAA